jgi:hypothetical protein
MSIKIRLNCGLTVVVFLHECNGHVLMPDSCEDSAIVIRNRVELLQRIREDWGGEVKGLTFLNAIRGIND